MLRTNSLAVAGQNYLFSMLLTFSCFFFLYKQLIFTFAYYYAIYYRQRKKTQN